MIPFFASLLGRDLHLSQDPSYGRNREPLIEVHINDGIFDLGFFLVTAHVARNELFPVLDIGFMTHLHSHGFSNSVELEILLDDCFPATVEDTHLFDGEAIFDVILVENNRVFVVRNSGKFNNFDCIGDGGQRVAFSRVGSTIYRTKSSATFISIEYL
jgi:hypothetical protein